MCVYLVQSHRSWGTAQYVVQLCLRSKGTHEPTSMAVLQTGSCGTQ